MSAIGNERSAISEGPLNDGLVKLKLRILRSSRRLSGHLILVVNNGYSAFSN